MRGDSNEHPQHSEAILMSTYNIGFYEDLTKNIFELSSNITKYAPYIFCCVGWLYSGQYFRNFDFFFCFVVAMYDIVNDMEAKL